MRRPSACMMAILLLSAGLAGAGPSGGNGEKDAAARAPAGTAGHCWSPERRLTSSTADDTDPSIVTSSRGEGSVTWYRDGTQMYMKLDAWGGELVPEKELMGAEMPRTHSGQPAERLAIDDGGNLHAISGFYYPAYQRFDGNGTPRCDSQPVSPWVSPRNPHCAALAAGKNGRAYIAFEVSAEVRLAIFDSDCTRVFDGRVSDSADHPTIGVDLAGNPWVFFREDTTRELWLARHDSTGQPFASPLVVDSGYSGPWYDMAVPSLAFGADGAVHLLLASRASGTRTLYYIKLDRNGERLTSNITVTDDAVDFGDICVDSSQTVHVVWGDVDRSLHHVRIFSGQENATLEERELTSSDHVASDPRLSVDPANILHVVWVEEQDGNLDVFHSLQWRGGIELAMTPEDQAKLNAFHANESRSSNFSVRNAAGIPDNVRLNITADFHGAEGGVGRDYDGPGWKAWLSLVSETLPLEPFETLKARVSVRAPHSGRPNEHIDVTINASSGLDPSVPGLTFRCYLLMSSAFDLLCPESVLVCGAGEDAAFLIQVRSRGTAETAVVMSAGGPSGWNWALGRENVSLDPGGSAELTLTVTPPLTAEGDETGLVMVTGRCADDPSVFSTVTTRTVVRPVTALEISADRPAAEVDPGGSAEFIITLGNRGNVVPTQVFILEACCSGPDWKASLHVSWLSLTAGESGCAVLRVSAPADSLAGSSCTVNVTAFDLERTTTCSVELSAVVRWVHRIAAEGIADTVEVVPGGSAGFAFRVHNLGNAPEEVRPAPLDLPAGWALRVETENGTELGWDIPLLLEAGSSAVLLGVLDCPPGEPVGEVRGSLQLADSAGNLVPVAFSVRVLQSYFIKLETSTPARDTSPGEAAVFHLTVTNLGNGPDNITFQAGALPPDWPPVMFHDDAGNLSSSISLEKGQRGWMSAVLTVPRSAAGNSVEFIVTALSEGGPCEFLTLGARLEKADLVVTAAEPASRNLTVGRAVAVAVTVENRGEARAEDVEVAFSRNGVVKAREELGTLLPGEVRHLMFAWTPLEGKNRVEFTVDPDRELAEGNETNNTFVLERTLYRDLARVQRGTDWGPIALAVAAAAFLVPAFLLLRRRSPARTRASNRPAKEGTGKAPSPALVPPKRR